MRIVRVALLLLLGAAAAGAGESHVRIVPIADFERPDYHEDLTVRGLHVQRVKAWFRADGHFLRVVAAEQSPVSVLEFERVPRDVRGREALVFRARTLLDPPATLLVGLVDAAGRRLDLPITLESEIWSDVSVPLARMRPQRGFDPTQVERLYIVGRTAFDVDDLRFVTGHGDWRVEEALLKRAFGPDGLSKVEHVRTRHFDLYTDSAAARGAFARKLEETYDQMQDALRVQEMGTHLPVYLFRTRVGYVEFCVRFEQWPRAFAWALGGHGSGRHFATWYTAPRSRILIHELAHSVFHRAVGSGGGSWLQEGAAVYAERWVAGRSAARIFACRLRSRRHVPLAEFVSIRSLGSGRRPNGERYPLGWLYPQAGAFFEFLVRGPLFAGEECNRPPALPEEILALARGERNPSVETIEAYLGHSMEVLEEAWLRWGCDPPRP